ncbi:hypothetical protein RhiLY_11345 [Ceratobasidium sp. AG-Ba]|nr:hypothetical protein RhiLY_11345 [Ceratobasidium sp. AG-Ba]
MPPIDTNDKFAAEPSVPQGVSKGVVVPVPDPGPSLQQMLQGGQSHPISPLNQASFGSQAEIQPRRKAGGSSATGNVEAGDGERAYIAWEESQGF